MNTVMVVEDEQLIAKDIADTLTKLGYDVTGTVASGEECVESARSRRPDLVLMDIHLEGEMDGVRAAELLRERFDVPVVFLSAYADDKTLDRAKLTGPLGYLLKPFRKSELKSAVEVGLYRHQLERQLRERERWFSTTLRAIGDAVITVDAERRIEFMNRAAEALLGRAERDARGAPLAEIARLLNEKTREPIDDPVSLALDRKQVIRIPPHTVLVAGQRELPVEDSIAPILGQRGEQLGAVIVMRDVSERRRVEQQIAVADRLASLGAVAAGIAHEINNPLTYILGNIGFMGEALERLGGLTVGLAPESRVSQLEDVLSQLTELVHDIDDGATRVGRIVADLGFFGRRRVESRRGAPVPALQWALRVSQGAITPHARITLRLDPVPDVTGDDGGLGQIFLNLLLNAGYAMRTGDPEHNELYVSTELEPGNGADHVLVTVKDTGCGMTPEVMARIFDPFFTTKPIGTGTGLGLSVCHGVIEEMGGTIHVQSNPGQGSTFVVRLPVALGPAMASSRPPERTELRARVLVIDDDPRVLSVVARMIRPIHDVATCDTANAALALIEKGESFDAIVCDFLMPGMNGADFYRALEARRPEYARRVIFVSGGGNTELASEFFRSVPNACLAKPPALEELLQAVNRQVARSAREEHGPGASSAVTS
jgi:two-component system cell cycle sensor histidine kinase/response regulator CckA